MATKKKETTETDYSLTALVLLKGVDFLNHTSNLTAGGLRNSYNKWAGENADIYEDDEIEEIREEFMAGTLE
jgi:hypothetical protein